MAGSGLLCCGVDHLMHTVHDRLAQAVSLLQADGKNAQMLRLQGLRWEVVQTLNWLMLEQQHFSMWHDIQLQMRWTRMPRAALLVSQDCKVPHGQTLHCIATENGGNLCRSDCDACTDSGKHVQTSLLTHVQSSLASVVRQQHAG